MAIKFENVTSPPTKAAEKREAVAPKDETPAKAAPESEAGADGKAPARKLKSRNTLKK